MTNPNFYRSLLSDAGNVDVVSQLTHDTRTCVRLRRDIKGKHIKQAIWAGMIRKNYVFFLTKEPTKVVEEIQEKFRAQVATRVIPGGVYAWWSDLHLNESDFDLPLFAEQEVEKMLH